MPILDDEQFEQYLKEFRPVAPESLQIEKQPSRARRPFAYLAWAAACAASVLLVFLLWNRLKPPQPSVTPQLVRSQPLTIGRANALLAHAPSLKEAFDDLSFQSQPASQPSPPGYSRQRHSDSFPRNAPNTAHVHHYDSLDTALNDCHFYCVSRGSHGSALEKPPEEPP